MNKPNLSKFFNEAKNVIGKRSPEILTGIGVAGMVTTVVLAVKATPKALDLIARAEDEKFDNGHGNSLTKLEVVKAAWKPYIPVAISGVVSAACIIGATSVNSRRNAALATAYKIAETSLHEYREKVIETIGEKKESAVRDKVNAARIEKNPVESNEVIITGKGNTLCLDVISGRYFNSDIDKLKRVENELNAMLLSQDYISLNEFYDAIGLSHTSIGDQLGWNMGRDGLIKLYFSTQLSEDGTPCIVVDYSVAPRYDYSSFH